MPPTINDQEYGNAVQGKLIATQWYTWPHLCSNFCPYITFHRRVAPILPRHGPTWHFPLPPV